MVLAVNDDRVRSVITSEILNLPYDNYNNYNINKHYILYIHYCIAEERYLYGNILQKSSKLYINH